MNKVICKGPCGRKLSHDLENFPSEKNKISGLSSTCKICNRERLRVWRIERGKQGLPCPTPGCSNTLKGGSRCDKCENQIRRHGKTFDRTRRSKNLIIKHNDTSSIYIFDELATRKLLGIATIDSEDLHIVRKYKWHLKQNAITTNSSKKRLVNHLVDCPSGMQALHLDGNFWNCRKNNIEVVNRSTANRYNKISASNKSGVKGVTWCKRSNNWEVYITNNGQRYTGGNHTDLIKAIQARKELEIEHWGEVFSGKSESIKEQLQKSFIKHYNLLKEASDKNDGFSTEDSKRLGESFNHFRKSRKKGNLTLEQITMLEAIKGFEWYRRKDFNNNDYYDRYFLLLAQFLKREGHLLVPVDTHIESGTHLGDWVNRMRIHYRKGSLPQKIINRLESYKEWIWEPNIHTEQATFERHLNIFLDYVSKNGALSTWEPSIRKSCDYMVRRKKVKTLSENHISILESIPGWSWQRQKDNWVKKYELVKQNYKTILSESTKCVFEGIKIGCWINQQRTFYKAKKLPLERIKLLELIPGWVWKHRESNDVQWQIWFEALEEYTNKTGSSRIEETTVFKDLKIGQWCGVQRRKYRGQIYPLTSEQIKMLESLKGWEWAPSRFNDNVKRLQEFALTNKNTLVPKEFRTEDNHPLGSWVSKQRSNFRYGKLSQDKILKLQQVPNWVWERKSMDWDDYYFLVRAEANQTDKFPITNRTVVDGHKIGFWVQRQRASYRKGELTQEKIDLLEEINNWWWSRS
jgi:hypothetical protein